MGTRYQHLTIEERCELARLRAEGHSVRQIAAGLEFPLATGLGVMGLANGEWRWGFSREVKRAPVLPEPS